METTRACRQRREAGATGQWEALYGPPAPGAGPPSRWDVGSGLTHLVRLPEALEGHIARDLAQWWRELAPVDAIFAELSADPASC